MQYLEYLQNNPGGAALILFVLYLIWEKVISPLLDLLKQQTRNQHAIVQASASEATRSDGMLSRVIDLLGQAVPQLSQNITQLSALQIKIVSILDEIHTLSKDTNVAVHDLPPQIEERFKNLELQLARSQQLHARTQKMQYWTMQKLNLPVDELRKKG